MLRIVLDPAKCCGCRVCEGVCSLVNIARGGMEDDLMHTAAESRENLTLS